MTRRMVERHVWQDALDDVIAFTKSEQGRRIYRWRKETIERSFAEAKVNHGLRYARMLGIRNMREQSFLTAAVQNIKRLVASSFSLLLRLLARLPLLEAGFVSGLTAACRRASAYTFVNFLVIQIPSCRSSYSSAGGLFFYCLLFKEQSRVHAADSIFQIG